MEDPSSRHGLKLLIQDYPFAEDGLEVWAAIKQWATDYVGIYYKTDEAVHADEELQHGGERLDTLVMETMRMPIGG